MKKFGAEAFYNTGNFILRKRLNKWMIDKLSENYENTKRLTKININNLKNVLTNTNLSDIIKSIQRRKEINQKSQKDIILEN